MPTAQPASSRPPVALEPLRFEFGLERQRPAWLSAVGKLLLAVSLAVMLIALLTDWIELGGDIASWVNPLLLGATGALMPMRWLVDDTGHLQLGPVAIDWRRGRKEAWRIPLDEVDDLTLAGTDLRLTLASGERRSIKLDFLNYLGIQRAKAWVADYQLTCG